MSHHSGRISGWPLLVRTSDCVQLNDKKGNRRSGELDGGREEEKKVKRGEKKGKEELITERVNMYSMKLEGRRLQRGRIRKNQGEQ